MRSKGTLTFALALATALAGTVGSSGCSTARPTGTPGVDEVGTFVRTYKGKELEAALGYRFASQNPGDEWLMLDLALTSAYGTVTKVERGNIFVRTPNGERVPMATQGEFAEAYGDLRARLKRADIMRDPIDYFPPDREQCRAGFFAVPGENVVQDELTLNERRVCEGRVFFHVPGGVQPGKWTLGIDLPESRVRIPFTIGE